MGGDGEGEEGGGEGDDGFEGDLPTGEVEADGGEDEDEGKRHAQRRLEIVDGRTAWVSAWV